MISEPELVGGDGDVPTPPSPYGPAPAVEPEPGGERRAPRPWLWALGGALVASALWAGGLYAYQAVGPGLGGYRTPDDLCEEAELAALSTAFGTRDGASQDMHEAHEALDQVQCSVTFVSGEQSFGADLSYALHKKTDPGPEFEPAETAPSWDELDWEPVEGVGERAFYAQDGEGFAGLKVLDGQAVLTLFVSMHTEYDPETGEEPPEPDASAMSGVKDLMVEDMKALMAGLRH
ncbi:hypothetical protein AMK26_09325 [Streptomyces sp. CB03234]|uniref:hypothetical protein n=1 Tax=Streptomyces sp. (strain CB03234) TaxID=1703937 RepID=UPI00093B092E|nr:hypothetical protein [Streptomyces sp. CB03234]OKK06242.1 hypothetical protein AMK26_09325 [Streptomyces sp. CB03234]